MLGKRKEFDYDEDECNEEKRAKLFDFRDLHPFDCLISSPPIVYFTHYSKLTQYFTEFINNPDEIEDFNVDLPLELLGDLGLVEDATQCWRNIIQSIVEAKASSERKDTLWDRLADVDKIICLMSDEDSNLISNGQLELWWVKQADSWFVRNSDNNAPSYIDIAFDALILESFYRFTWARFTSKMYYKGLSMQMDTEMENTDEVVNTISRDEEIVTEEDLGLSDEEEEELKLKELNSSNQFDLPNVVDLFFCHHEISSGFDSIESEFFTSISSLNELSESNVAALFWNIEPVIDILIGLAAKKENESSTFSNSTKLKTRKEFLETIMQAYIRKHVPFLKKLGIFVNPKNPFVSLYFNFIIM